MNGSLDLLYKGISEHFDIGTWQEFSAKMQTPDDRKRFFEIASTKVDLGGYDEYEARGWAHDDTTKGYKPTTKTKPTKTEKVVAKGETKKAKITAKAAKKTAEVTENVDKKTAKISKKEAKKTHGKGSKEHLEAKKKHLEAKEADRQGEKGGKKQGFFRKLASKINKKRQAKIDKKLAE